MLEQHEDNLPNVQLWIDKFAWRGKRVLALVAMMMDYMLPKRIMSWQEAWEMYFEEAGGALFADLARYGIRPPKMAEVAAKEKSRLSHEVWSIFYNYTHAAAFHTWMPSEDEMRWLAEKYPDTFERYYRPRYDHWIAQEKAGNRFYNQALPMLCQVCQIPMAFTEPDDPRKICFRSSDFGGDNYHFCSDGCKEIFDFEPKKYVQAWLPVHQIYQGNCGGATVPEVLDWYHLNQGADNLDYNGSPDQELWEKWKADRARAAS
jgi:phenol hydroxylase P3 protein